MKNIMMMILTGMMIFIPSLSFSFTPDQQRLMSMAYALGEPHGLGQTMVAIAYQETNAGVTGPVGDKRHPVGQRSYGVMQIKLETAKYAFRLCPYLDRDHDSEEEIIADLIDDKKWNMEISLCYLRQLEKGRTWRETVLAYNQGANGASAQDPNSHEYVRDIINHITEGGAVYEFLQRQQL